jgi:hypothetical protein
VRGWEADLRRQRLKLHARKRKMCAYENLELERAAARPLFWFDPAGFIKPGLGLRFWI